jgi:toxin FitB
MTVLLDTNVLSELMRPRPSPVVTAWVASRALSSLWVSTITEAEMWLGARILSPGAKRLQIEASLKLIFDDDFSGRIWPFDSAAANAYAKLLSQRRAAGRPMAQFDGQIAAIASVRGAALATRNVEGFEGCDLVVLNPWLASHSPAA